MIPARFRFGFRAKHNLVKSTRSQFNCEEGDTVIVVRRKRGRMLREVLTITRTGVKNEHGHPLNFEAVGKSGEIVTLSPFEGSDDLRVIILPKKLPAELARFKSHRDLIVARAPGCDRFTYRLVSRKNLEPVCRIRLERQSQDILFSDGIWWARDEELVSATEFFSAGGKRIALTGLKIES